MQSITEAPSPSADRAGASTPPPTSSRAAGTFTTFGSEATADGITYGASFTTFSVDVPRQHVRWGIACRNGSSGVSESCAATLRIDVRGA